jgi:hypothetical protein
MRSCFMTNTTKSPKPIQPEMPQAGPHATPENTVPDSAPGTGVLPKPGKADDDEMAPTG